MKPHFKLLNTKHLTQINLLLISLFVILGVLFFSPVQAEETASSTPNIIEETSTSTPEVITPTSIATTTTEITTPTSTPTTTPETTTCTDAISCVSTTTPEIITPTSTPTTTIEIIIPTSTPTTTPDITTATTTPTSTYEIITATTTVENKTIEQIVIDQTVAKILNYLKSKQTTTGKIMDGTITDWAIMSFGANGQYADAIKQTKGKSLLEYEKEYNLDDSSDLNSCATYPRHVLALLAAGVTVEDEAIQGLKNKMLTTCYANNHYGLNGINDDIFALLALLAVEVEPNETIITDIVSTTLSWQMTNGAFSWPDWTDPTQKVAGDDITGATINALQYAKNKGVNIDKNILTKAKDYLKSTQQTDGGWGWGSSDIMTTSWVLMGINALKETQADWFTTTGKNPWQPLVNNLNEAGYYESAWVPGTEDWFAMKHAVPALKGVSWPIILDPIVEDFSEGATFTYGGGGGSNYVPPVKNVEEIVTTTPTSTFSIIKTPTTTNKITTATTTPTSTLDIKINTSTCTNTMPCLSTTTLNQAGNDEKNILPAGRQEENFVTLTTTDFVPTQSVTPKNKTNKPINNLTINPPKIATTTEISTTTLAKAEIAPTQILSSDTGSTPLQKTAKGVFGITASMAGTLGLYLGWRFLQSLV